MVKPCVKYAGFGRKGRVCILRIIKETDHKINFHYGIRGDGRFGAVKNQSEIVPDNASVVLCQHRLKEGSLEAL
jgi:hypothetical protein